MASVTKAEREAIKNHKSSVQQVFQVYVYRNGRVIAFTSSGEEIKEFSGKWEDKEQAILDRILSGIPQAVITFNVDWPY